MLDALKKSLGIKHSEATAEKLESTQESSTDLSSLQASFEAQAEQLSTLTSQLAEANSLLQKANSALAEVEGAKAQAIAEAKEIKMTARKAVVTAAIGDMKADAFLAATEMLDDVAFKAVSAALAGSVEAEASTSLFKEVGVDAKPSAESAEAVESLEMQIIKSKQKATSK